MKPWRQKGTGRARQGSIRSPHWAGGGVVFGPMPRDHAHELPKKVRARGAARRALAAREREGALTWSTRSSSTSSRRSACVELLSGARRSTDERVLVVLDGAEREARALGAQPAATSTCCRPKASTSTTCCATSDLVLTRAALERARARASAPSERGGVGMNLARRDPAPARHREEHDRRARSSNHVTVRGRPAREQARDQARRRGAVRGARRSTSARCGCRGKMRRVGPLRRQAPGLEEGDRHAWPRARRSSSSRESRRDGRSRIYKPTSPGRRQMTRLDFAEITRKRPRALAARGRCSTSRAAATTTATSPSRHHGGGHKRPLPHHRLPARQDRHPGARSRRSSTTRTAPRASRCSTTRTARSATSSRRSASRSATR